MPINSRDKGNRAEREVAKTINRYLGTNCRRTPLSGGLSIKGDIIDIDPDSVAAQYHFEIKNTKKLSLPMWWKQINNDNTSKIPVNIFKMNGKFYSTLELNDWLSDLAEVKELKEEIDSLKTSNKSLNDRISELEKELYG
tara:strand:+ start:530 stop:949 length:420 start_codon:yes stop_codon:yes gene_type:complete